MSIASHSIGEIPLSAQPSATPTKTPPKRTAKPRIDAVTQPEPR